MSWVKANVLQVVCILLGGLLLAQTALHLRERTAHAALRAEVAADKERRATAALKHEIFTASKERTHAAETQENADEFVATQATRDAIARVELARAERLRTDAERRAATYRAMAESGAAACRDLADRHAALDRHIVDGTRVVADLGAALDRRDAEVALLRRQIDVDRALITGQGAAGVQAGAAQEFPAPD